MGWVAPVVYSLLGWKGQRMTAIPQTDATEFSTIMTMKVTGDGCSVRLVEEEGVHYYLLTTDHSNYNSLYAALLGAWLAHKRISITYSTLLPDGVQPRIVHVTTAP